jgi:hypothetical protein
VASTAASTAAATREALFLSKVAQREKERLARQELRRAESSQQQQQQQQRPASAVARAGSARATPAPSPTPATRGPAAAAAQGRPASGAMSHVPLPRAPKQGAVMRTQILPAAAARDAKHE